jgi:hypothetical protein
MPNWLAARFFSIASELPPMIITFTSSSMRPLVVLRLKPLPPRICAAC